MCSRIGQKVPIVGTCRIALSAEILLFTDHQGSSKIWDFEGTFEGKHFAPRLIMGFSIEIDYDL